MTGRPITGRRLALAGALGIALAIILPTFAADAQSDAAYRRQFQALAPNDMQGHVKLALWCRDQQAWDLLLQQCNHILSVEPNHQQGKLLHKLARTKLPAIADPAGGAGQPASVQQAAKANAGGFKLLSQEQVYALRRVETRLDRPEKLKVEFRNHVVDRFWELYTSRVRQGPQDRVSFNKMSRAAKAQTMLLELEKLRENASEQQPFEDTYSEDILILNDPMMFREFRLHVWPIILNGCATARCHGGPYRQPFVLFRDRTMDDLTLYTNYLILHEYKKDGRPVINRDHPADSLLLLYGQPNADNAVNPHKVEITPLFRSPRERKYQVLLRWINELGVPAPDYGITLDDLR